MRLPTEIENHRLGAFIYGFLSGVGLIMIIWGLASIAVLPSTNLLTNIGLTFFGVALFVVGSCREAYIRGNLSMSSELYTYKKKKQSEKAKLISEQIIERPTEDELQEAHTS